MTKVLFQHIVALRANLRHIGAAVSASSEFTSAGTEASGANKSAIPL